MRNSSPALLLALALASCSQPSGIPSASLKDAVGDKFLVGVALNQRQVSGADSLGAETARKHFNCIVAENCMKCEKIHPAPGIYDFAAADSLVSFATRDSMKVVGHCLIWHSQLAPWFCVDTLGNPVSPEELLRRMKDHITTVVSRYKGKVIGWDVVNEAFLDDGSWRPSPFYEILGEDYLPFAFRCAAEADPEAELYYNDYCMFRPAKRQAVVSMISRLKAEGIRIDAVGMQSHLGIDYPEPEEFERSILAFSGAGVNVMITEWDMSALPTLSESADVSASTLQAQGDGGRYPDCLPDSVCRLWNSRMADFFSIMLRHSDVITRVTAWGVSDGDSWKNNYPVRGRRD